MNTNAQNLYVTRDGAWGIFEGDDLKIVNASGWTEEDLNELDEACDSEKYEVVTRINDRIIDSILEGLKL